MSYLPIEQYSRPILRPISVASESLINESYRSSPTTSPLWKATTHTFTGTINREPSTAWPPDKFHLDPIAIPDDSAHNIPYDPKSAEHASSNENGVYQMYEHKVQQSLCHREQVPPPRIVVKRYIPIMQPMPVGNKSRSRITLLLLPGMGLPKELFEPLIEGVISKSLDKAFEVIEIWSVDMPMSGETALANPIGYLYGNEKDIARDLLLFVTAYLPVHPGEDLPAELIPRQSTSTTGPQPTRKNLHVVGHSLGAQSAILIAAHAPKLFSSLTMFDPAMIPDGKIRKAFTVLPKDTLCTNIKYTHSDRAALQADIRNNKRTKGWDERVVKLFVERGAVVNAEGNLQLVAHPRLEWALYYDQETPTHCYDRLADVKVPLNAIMPSRPFAVPPKMLEAYLAAMPQRTQLTWIPNATHQVPFEKIHDCVGFLVSWLQSINLGQVAKL